MIKPKRDFKGIWIPKEIWLNEDLTLQEKIFLVEIDSLDNEEGCWASNKYFADFFNITTQRASQVINSLKQKNFLEIFYIRGKENNNIEKRIIKTNLSNIFDTGIKKTFNRYQENIERVSRKIEEGYQEKFKENNTLYNNTFNNTFKDSSNIVAEPIKENKFEIESEEYKLAEYLYKAILKNDKKYKKPNLDNWAIHIDRLIRLDNRSEEEIKRVIDFATNDDFWKANILSTKKLRKHFSKLLIQMKNKSKRNYYKQGPRLDDTSEEIIMESVTDEAYDDFLNDIWEE